MEYNIFDIGTNSEIETGVANLMRNGLKDYALILNSFDISIEQVAAIKAKVEAEEAKIKAETERLHSEAYNIFDIVANSVIEEGVANLMRNGLKDYALILKSSDLTIEQVAAIKAKVDAEIAEKAAAKAKTEAETI
jgi:hypothetical protein